MATAARYDRPPLHPIWVGLPLACFAGALASDIAYARTADAQWTSFSSWLIAGGLLLGLFGTVTGVIDLVGRRVPGVAALPFALAMVLELFNVLVHSRDGWTSVVPAGLTLSVLAVIAMLVAFGWGGVLSRRSVSAFR